MKNNLFNGRLYSIFGLVLGLLYASPATAGVCFLPDINNCIGANALASPDQTPEDCSRLTRQGYTAFAAEQSGVDCQLCNGTYYCKCDGNYKKDGNRCVERCSATDYPLTSKKAAPWQCEACSDPLSDNYGRRYKNCTCPSPYTQIGSGKCVDCQGYDVSANEAATKQNNGYSCSACDNDAASGKYKCSCSGTEKTVNGVKKCFSNCTDDKKELNNDGVCVCKSNYPNEYNNACYPVCSAPKSRFEKGECLCSAEYSHTQQAGETCTEGCTDKNGTKYKTCSSSYIFAFDGESSPTYDHILDDWSSTEGLTSEVYINTLKGGWSGNFIGFSYDCSGDFNVLDMHYDEEDGPSSSPLQGYLNDQYHAVFFNLEKYDIGQSTTCKLTQDESGLQLTLNLLSPQCPTGYFQTCPAQYGAAECKAHNTYADCYKVCHTESYCNEHVRNGYYCVKNADNCWTEKYDDRISDLQELCLVQGDEISGRYESYMRQKYNFASGKEPGCDVIIPLNSGIYCAEGDDSGRYAVGHNAKGEYAIYEYYDEVKLNKNFYYVGYEGLTFSLCGNISYGNSAPEQCNLYEDVQYVEDYFMPTLNLGIPPNLGNCDDFKTNNGIITNYSASISCKMSACKSHNVQLLKDKGLDSKFINYFNSSSIY